MYIILITKPYKYPLFSNEILSLNVDYNQQVTVLPGKPWTLTSHSKNHDAQASHTCGSSSFSSGNMWWTSSSCRTLKLQSSSLLTRYQDSVKQTQIYLKKKNFLTRLGLHHLTISKTRNLHLWSIGSDLCRFNNDLDPILVEYVLSLETNFTLTKNRNLQETEYISLWSKF